ncbi:MAG: hypothetical protein ABWZ40_05765 [Caulobacterales bacterium]
MASRLKIITAVLFAAFAFNACSPKSEPKKHADADADADAKVEEPAPTPPPLTEDANGVTITLADCAGATAFIAGISPIKQKSPESDKPDENFYWTLLALLDKEPGFEGEAGRLAAETAFTAWVDKPEANVRTYVDACKTRYAQNQDAQ